MRCDITATRSRERGNRGRASETGTERSGEAEAEADGVCACDFGAEAKSGGLTERDEGKKSSSWKSSSFGMSSG